MKRGYRKLALAVLFTVIGLTVDLTHQNGLSSQMVALLTGLYGAFAFGNFGEHLALSKVPQNVTAPATQDVTLHSKVEHLMSTAAVQQEALNFMVNYIQSYETQKKAALQQFT